MAIYFIRHGQSESNRQGIYAGQEGNPPLTDRGREEVSAALPKLRTLSITQIISSDADRARETATIIAADLGFPEPKIEIDPRLREVLLGGLVGTPSRGYLGYLAAAETPGNPDNVEPVPAVEARLKGLIKDELSDPSQTTLLVGHHDSGLVLWSLYSHRGLRAEIAIPNATIVTLEAP